MRTQENVLNVCSVAESVVFKLPTIGSSPHSAGEQKTCPMVGPRRRVGHHLTRACSSFLQEYRHVDYMSFHDPESLQSFVGAWIKSGKQRYGVLYGHYDR